MSASGKNIDRLRQELTQHLAQLRETKPPKGFHPACQDIDIAIFEYEGYIAGFVSSCLEHGKEIDPEHINLREDLDRQIDDCETRLHNLKAYRNMLRETADLLIKYLKAKS